MRTNEDYKGYHMNENMTDIEPGIGDGAVNVYQNDMTDEFPVLKAFQQYIDAEQAKARKRMMMLCVFFSFVLTVVIAVFVSLLLNSSSRNQNLNDRLIEYAMKDRERASAVTPPAHPDDSALRTLASKLEALQKAIDEDRARSEKATAETAAKAKNQPTAEALEIERLKALLAAEKEKAAAEREKQRQAELEAYRRKQYPELYGLKSNNIQSTNKESKKDRRAEEEEADREIESIIRDIKAIDYFDEEDDESDDRKKTSSSAKRAKQKKDTAPSEGDVEVPSEIKDSSGNTWEIPEE